jgi:hypothetical protein
VSNGFCDSIHDCMPTFFLQYLHYTRKEPILAGILDHRVAISDLTGRGHKVAINVMISSVKRYTP